MINTQTIDFFKHLSWKYRKENDLSDITWAMCQSCESFRDSFLSFFFPEIQIEKNICIEREKSEDDSRPDFYIDNNGEIFLIENKIYDANHHFGQYDSTFNFLPIDSVISPTIRLLMRILENKDIGYTHGKNSITFLLKRHYSSKRKSLY